MRFTTSYGSFTSWRHWNGGLFQGNHPYNWPQVSTIFRWVKYYSSVRLYTYITVHINIIYPDWGMVIYPILWYDKGSSFPVVQLPGLALLTLAAFALRKGIFSWCSEHSSQFCDPCSWKVTSPRIDHTRINMFIYTYCIIISRFVFGIHWIRLWNKLFLLRLSHIIQPR